MYGALSASCRPLRDAVGCFLTQLAQNDRRRPTEIADRSELEVEEDRDRDGDRHGEADREPQAAVAHHRLTADGPTPRPALAEFRCVPISLV